MKQRNCLNCGDDISLLHIRRTYCDKIYCQKFRNNMKAKKNRQKAAARRRNPELFITMKPGNKKIIKKAVLRGDVAILPIFINKNAVSLDFLEEMQGFAQTKKMQEHLRDIVMEILGRR